MIEVAGYISAIIIGITLGLIGGGGSILTVPALVYILDVDPVHATAYSLFIVGIAALTGSVTYMKKEMVSYRTAVVFAIPAFIAVFAARKFIIPNIPVHFFSIGGFDVTKDLFIMILFALMMLAASVSMIKGRKDKSADNEKPEFNYPLIFTEGIIVGLFTGIVGAGGGFLIIPALVVFAKLPMKMAVGTSLLIIAVKSLIGFTGDIAEQDIEWLFLVIFSVFTIAGIIAGGYLSNYIPGKKLKPAFGWFVLVMGIFILSQEIFKSL